MRRLVVGPGIFVAALLATSSCRPSIDGAWEGSAKCDANTLPLSALFNEDADANLDGTVYIEGVLFGGFIAKGTIDNGDYDPDDNEYNFDLQTDEDETPELDVTLAFNEKDVDELEGDARILDDNGEETDQCDVELDRVSVND
jgi:hypothetical protein